MIVTVIAVRMVQVAVDEVVDVVAVRDRLVTAVGTVDVVGRVCAACVGGAAGRVSGVDVERVLFDSPRARVVQMPVVHVVDVVAVRDGGVSAARAVNVIVVVVGVGHERLLFVSRQFESQWSCRA